MMIDVRPAAASATGYVLLENGAPIGWLRAAVIGFGGFASAADASRAAARAVPELQVWYRTRWLGDPIPWLEPVEASARVECDGEVVGRLLPPPDPSSLPTEGFGFELRIPTGLWVGTCEALCQRLARAMRADADRVDDDLASDSGGREGGYRALSPG